MARDAKTKRNSDAAKPPRTRPALRNPAGPAGASPMVKIQRCTGTVGFRQIAIGCSENSKAGEAGQFPSPGRQLSEGCCYIGKAALLPAFDVEVPRIEPGLKGPFAPGPFVVQH